MTLNREQRPHRGRSRASCVVHSNQGLASEVEQREECVAAFFATHRRNAFCLLGDAGDEAGTGSDEGAGTASGIRSGTPNWETTHT